MARNVQLLQLIADLRAETGRTQNVAVGIDELDNLKAILRRTQKTLYDEHEWEHMRVQRTISLNAGQRYYDFPADLDFDALDDIKLQYNSVYQDIERGIDFEDYSAFDSNNNERSSPARKWDIRNTGSKEQLEIWPIPNDNIQTLYIFGKKKLGNLIQEADTCDLDDVLIVMYAAAEILARQESPDAKRKAEIAQARLYTLKRNAEKRTPTIQMGLGQKTRPRNNGVKIVVS